MNNKDKRYSNEMVATKNKNKVISCSTPEHRAESPSRDSDSICDSEAASPVPFYCTQDGAEGETDVVWNFYTPKSENAAKSRIKNSTPVSRRSRRSIKPKINERQPPKRRALKQTSHKKTELFQELIELNQNLVELMSKKSQNAVCTEKVNSGSEDDFMTVSPEFSPKSRIRSNSRCLRRNVLSSNFVKPDPETALESDDSMNECLIKASQVVEENILNEAPVVKRPCYETNMKKKVITSDLHSNIKMDQDSMDAILNSIKLDSPIVKNVKKCASPQLNNDSFDSLVGNLNDSALDRLTQMPVKMDTSRRKNDLNSPKDGNSWTIKELIVHESTPSSKSIFSRHNSMPVSPTVTNIINKPSTSGMVFGRYNSMPFGKDAEDATDLGDSPIRCTPEEIKKKHQLAREKLLAKRLLPFTSSQKITQSLPSTQMSQYSMPKINEEAGIPKKLPETIVPKKVQFQPKVASNVVNVQNKPIQSFPQKTSNSVRDLKSIIEKKRQEALMKLRRRQIQSK